MGIYAIESGGRFLGGTGVGGAGRKSFCPHRSGLQPDGHPQKPAGSRPLGASSVPKQFKARAWCRPGPAVPCLPRARADMPFPLIYRREKRGPAIPLTAAAAHMACPAACSC